jgi:hypothetical protein
MFQTIIRDTLKCIATQDKGIGTPAILPILILEVEEVKQQEWGYCCCCCCFAMAKAYAAVNDSGYHQLMHSINS